MKPADIDWSMLRGALLLLVVVACVSIALVASSWAFWERMEKGRVKLERELRTVQVRYRTVDEEQEMLEKYFPRFQELAQLGIIGREYRLDWIETLRDARETLKIPALEYVIKSQEPYQPKFSAPGGVYQPFASEMTLDAGLLHEEDLIALLRVLDRKARGLYSVKSCSIDRRRNSVGSPSEPHLATVCSLQWFTIKKPGEETGAAS